MVDLNELQKEIDDLLDKETDKSLLDWYKKTTMNKDIKSKNVIGIVSLNSCLRECHSMKPNKYVINPSIRYFDRGSYNKSMYQCDRLKIKNK